MAKKKAKSKTKPSAETPSFEESLSALEQVVADLEGGELGLDEALERYQQGVTRLKTCQQQLEQAERRIELLSGVDAQGNPISEPLEDASGGSLEEKAGSRAQRRSRPTAGAGDSSKSTGVDDLHGLF